MDKQAIVVTAEDRTALRAAWDEYACWMGDPDGKDDTETAFEEAVKFIAAHRIAATEAATMAERWMPIETAPKDGRTIWVLDTLYSKPWHYECIWNGIQWYHGFGDSWPEARPTHWMPLPPPPAIRGADDGQ